MRTPVPADPGPAGAGRCPSAYAARSVTVLLRMRQLASALSFAAVILTRAGWFSGTNDAPTLALSSAPLPAGFVMVARMEPSTTSGVIDRRTLNVAVPESTSTIAANVGIRFGVVGEKSTGNCATTVSAGPDCSCSLGSVRVQE